MSMCYLGQKHIHINTTKGGLLNRLETMYNTRA